jgi:hypothetical protein
MEVNHFPLLGRGLQEEFEHLALRRVNGGVVDEAVVHVGSRNSPRRPAYAGAFQGWTPKVGKTSSHAAAISTFRRYDGGSIETDTVNMRSRSISANTSPRSSPYRSRCA